MNDTLIREELSKYFVETIRDNNQVCINVEFDTSNIVLFRNKQDFLMKMTEYVKTIYNTKTYSDMTSDREIESLVNYCLVKYSLRQMYRYIMFETSEDDVELTVEQEKRLDEIINIISDRFTINDSERRNSSTFLSKVDVMNTLFTG